MSTIQPLPLDAFDEMTSFDAAPAAPTVQSTPPQASSAVTASRVEPSATHLLAEPSDWTWEQLRDYVMAKLDAVPNHPGVRRDPLREKGIFSGFLKRFGARAPEIARYALETQPTPGWWFSAPIQPTRFCRGSDPYFALPILDQLNG